MGSLTVCRKKLKDQLSASDWRLIDSRTRALRATGLAPSEAAQKAVRDLIAEIRAEFPAQTQKVATATVPRGTPAEKKHPATVMGSRLLAVVSKNLGGLDPAWIAEFSVRAETKRAGKDGKPVIQWRNPMVPGVGKLFRKGGTQDLQAIAEVLESEGYMAPGSVERDAKEAGEAAKTMIRRSLERDEIKTLDEVQAEEQAAQDAEREAYYAELDAEAAREAEAEREAIMAESEALVGRIDDLGDDDIPWDLDAPSAASEQQTADFLGITIEELRNERLQEPIRQDEQAQAGGGQGNRADAGRAAQPPPEAGSTAQGQGADEGLTQEDGYLAQLFGTPAEQAAAQAKFDADAKAKKRDVESIRDAIAAQQKRATAEHDDWAGRVYKANKTQVDLRGDGPSKQDSMSIGAINESRRRNAMDALAQEMAALGKLADAVSTDSGADRVLSNLRELMDMADRAVASGNWPNETRDSMFESMLLDDLKFRGPGGKGNVTSNGLSKAILAAMPGPALTLESQTPESLKAKADRQTAAEKADAKEQRRLADKAKADAEAPEFTLTGSDRSADVAAAAGQMPLLSRKPNADDVDRLNSRNDLRVSPRLPTAVKATEDPMADQRLQPDLATSKRDPAAFEHNIGLMSAYPNFKGLRGNAERKSEGMLDHMVANLLWLHDHWKPEFRGRSKLWYVGANRIAHRWAKRFGVSPEQVAGVIAATSPQKDWFQNVSLAERILEAVINNPDTKWDSKMSALVRSRDWGKKEVPDPSVYEGKTLRDLHGSGTPGALFDMAVWIRAWDEANNPQVARVITPEGNLSAEFDAGKTGKPIALRWQSFPTIAKTLQVLITRTPAELSTVIGANHKVRSFYNNIIAPMAGEDVTIDTHAVAAALLRPLGSSSTEVFHNFGSGVVGEPGPKNSAITGMNGTYGIYAEAYRRAAAQRGVLPREMQSITWEAVRGLFRPEQKNESIRAQSDAIWENYARGAFNGNAARSQIAKLVGGVQDPAWTRSPAGRDESTRDSSYAAELPATSVRRTGAKPLDGGTRGNASSRDSETASPVVAVASRGDRQAQGIPFTDLERMVAEVSANWNVRAKPEVVATAADLPAPIVNALRSMNAMGTTRGLRMPDGRVYLVADRLNSIPEAQAVLFHEVYGHEGLRAFLGDRYTAQMALLRMANPTLAAEANAWYAQYGQDQINARVEQGMTRAEAGAVVRALAVEEALADRAGDGTPPKAWKGVMAALQKALRSMGLGWIADKMEAMTEAETYATLVGARRAIQSGRQDLPAWLHQKGDTAPALQRVWHGSPHKFDRFDTSAIGTGEGAQAYGYGLYFASRKEVAEHYRKTLAGAEFDYAEEAARAEMRKLTNFDDWIWKHLSDVAHDADFKPAKMVTALRAYADRYSGSREQIRKVADLIEDGRVLPKKGGRLYEVEVPEDSDMLLWDKPLKDQGLRGIVFSEGWQRELYRISSTKDVGDFKGADLYRAVSRLEGSDRAASDALARAGIKGIKYLDGISRNKPLRDVKREFLAELPEDADFNEVMDLIGAGTFSAKNEDVLRALAANDWLGFDYPAQAISAALGSQLDNFDPTPELVRAVAATQDDSTYNYVIFSGDDAQIQQALLKRDPPAVDTQQVEGRPVFKGPGIVLDFPLPTERFEVMPEPGQEVLNYPIMPTDSFESLGFVELLVENGKPIALLDIEVNREGRARGIGRKVIETLLAADPTADLNISNIVEDARGFWARMGVPEQNRGAGEAYDGTLNWQTYAQAQAENPPGTSRAGQAGGRARGRPDAGAEGRVQGSVGQAPLLSRAPNPNQAPLPAGTTTVRTSRPLAGIATGWRDPTNRLQFAPGAWLYSALGKMASPLLVKFQLKAASPELRRQLRQMKLDVQKAQDVAAAVARDMQTLSEAERTMVSDIIEKELATGIVPPAHAVRLAALMSQAMSAQSRDLVRLDMLSQESADRWDGSYLPRFYESKLRNTTDAWADAVRKLLGRTSVMKGIKGKHLKGRGMYEPIAESELPNWQAMGWEVRDPNYQPGRPSIDGKVLVWRDYTRLERDDMGEIRDAGFRFVMGYMQTQRDIALGRMFESMANDPESSSRIPRDGWLRVPDGTVEGTGAKRYGKLAGRYVPRETLSHLTQIEEAQSEAWQMYRKAMAVWKMGKTALNPVSHVNNILSNLTMAHFAGVSYHRADKYLAALKDFATGSQAVKDARDAGLFLGTMSDAELMDTLPQELKDLAVKADSKAIRSAKFVFDAMTFFVRKPMGAAYQAEDTFFRYLIYKDAIGRGMAKDDAVDQALRYIFAYDDLPKGARMIRDFGIPFFAYTYKAIPTLLHTALTHPVRFAAPAAVMWAANAASYAIANGDEEDDWWTTLQRYLKDEEFRNKVRDAEKLEREVLPPWMKGSTAMGTPKAIRLGMDEVTKLPVFIDVARIIPGGDLFDVSPNAGGLPIPQPLTPSHPLLTIATGMIGNKDLWTGKDLVDKNDTRGEATEKRADWMWKQISPAMAIGNYHWERTMNALAQASGGEITWMPEAVSEKYTGIGRDGLPVQPGYAAMQTFGIKARPLDLERSREISEGMQKKMIREIDAEVRQLGRLNKQGALSDKAYDKAVDLARTKKERLKEGLTVDGDAKD